jgi:hypothetical protein
MGFWPLAKTIPFAKIVKTGNSSRAQNSNGPVYRNFGRMEPWRPHSHFSISPLAVAASKAEVSSSSKTDSKFQSTLTIIDMEKEALKMT